MSMSVKSGSKSFRTLDDRIFVGDRKITKIYAGSTLVYPVDGIFKNKIWWKFNEIYEEFFTRLMVNCGGHYFLFHDDDFPVYRVGLLYKNRGGRYDLPYYNLYLTNPYYKKFITPTIKVYGFRALNDEILQEAISGEGDFSYHVLTPNVDTETGKIYYTYENVGAGININSRNTAGEYAALSYGISEVGGNFDGVDVRVFTSNASDAINYVIGNTE